MVIAVDDVQWLDKSSSAALSFALRRLTTDAVAILATRRVEPGSADVADPTGLIKARAIRLQVGPRGEDDVARILRERLNRAIAPPLAARVHEAARGNPFFSLEIAGRSVTRSQRLASHSACQPTSTRYSASGSTTSP